MNEDQKVMTPDSVESEGAPHDRTQAEQGSLDNNLERGMSSSHDSPISQGESSSSTEVEANVPGSNERADVAVEGLDREDTTAGGTGILRKASKEFVTYCKSELDQRKNSGDAFDKVLFDQAVEMTSRRLQTLESGGAA